MKVGYNDGGGEVALGEFGLGGEVLFGRDVLGSVAGFFVEGR
jgi:hypothetical protein